MVDALTLDQLRLFASVADEGSFSAAGRRLGRVPSAVGYGINKLEDQLGVAMFDRSGRRPTLTEAGRALLPDARRVLAQLSELSCRAQGISGGLEPVVSIAVSAMLPASLLVSLCREFSAKYPSVGLDLRSGVLEAIPELVGSGVCHLGISSAVGTRQPGLRRRFLLDVAMLPVAAPNHPLAQVSGSLATSVVEGHVQVLISSLAGASDKEVAVLSPQRWRVADVNTKRSLIRAGLGWGTLPYASVCDDLVRGTLVQLNLEAWGPEGRRISLSSIVSETAPPGPAGQWLLDQLPSICAQTA